MLDAGYSMLDRHKKHSLFCPVSRDQNPVFAYVFDLSVLHKLDTNFEILAYVDDWNPVSVCNRARTHIS